jgi:site-specific recombinase XerD
MRDLTIVESAGLAPIAQAETNPAIVYLGTLAPTGRRSMRAKLGKVAQLLDVADPAQLPWARLRYQHVARIRALLLEGGAAPATINTTLSALRGVAGEAFKLGLMRAEDLERIRLVKNVRGDRLPAGRALTAGELVALMDVCSNDSGPAGARDASIIALLYATGLRRSELAGLELGDYEQSAGALVVRGKGNKERIVYVKHGAAAALADWLTVRGDDPGPMFLPINRGGRIGRHAMTAQSVFAMLRRRGNQAAVRDFSPHDLRRTFIGVLLDAGADISTVQRMAGHANVTTTARYDRRPEEAKSKAAELIHVPYRGRSLLA